MEHISEEERKSYKPDENDQALNTYRSLDVTAIDDKKLQQVRSEVRNTIESMIDTAVQIKTYVDQRIRFELQQGNKLSRELRQWIELYIDLMDKIHKNIYGTKSTQEVNITHTNIASAIRESQKRGKVVDVEHYPTMSELSESKRDGSTSEDE